MWAFSNTTTWPHGSLSGTSDFLCLFLLGIGVEGQGGRRAHSLLAVVYGFFLGVKCAQCLWSFYHK